MGTPGVVVVVVVDPIDGWHGSRREKEQIERGVLDFLAILDEICEKDFKNYEKRRGLTWN